MMNDQDEILLEKIDKLEKENAELKRKLKKKTRPLLNFKAFGKSVSDSEWWLFPGLPLAMIVVAALVVIASDVQNAKSVSATCGSAGDFYVVGCRYHEGEFRVMRKVAGGDDAKYTKCVSYVEAHALLKGIDQIHEEERREGSERARQDARGQGEVADNR